MTNLATDSRAADSQMVNGSDNPLGEPLLPEPTYPEDWECCGSECGEMCVYQLYNDEKSAYDAQQKRLAAANKA